MDRARRDQQELPQPEQRVVDGATATFVPASVTAGGSSTLTLAVESASVKNGVDAIPYTMLGFDGADERVMRATPLVLVNPAAGVHVAPWSALVNT